MERFRLSLLLAVSGYIAVALAAALTTASVPGAGLLLAGAVSAIGATYPLLWIAGREVWSRGITLLALGVSLVLPCLPTLVCLALLRDWGLGPP